MKAGAAGRTGGSRIRPSSGDIVGAAPAVASRGPAIGFRPIARSTRRKPRATTPRPRRTAPDEAATDPAITIASPLSRRTYGKPWITAAQPPMIMAAASANSAAIMILSRHGPADGRHSRRSHSKAYRSYCKTRG